MSLMPAVNTGTGTTWDSLITSLVCSQMHLVCRMGIAILSSTEALKEREGAQRRGIPGYFTLKWREDAQYLNQEMSGSPDT